MLKRRKAKGKGEVMTKLDPNIPYHKVLMVLPKKRITQEKPLNEKYHYVRYDDSLFEKWCELQYGVNLFSSIEEARAALRKMLEKDRTFFEENFLFVMDKDENLAASAGLWYGNDFDEQRLRIHYVACDEKHQHQGLSQAMLTKLCMKYDTIPSKYPLYLSTQSQSYGAIRLYARIGFTPYLGAYKGHTKEQSEKDWEATTDILREYA